MAKRKKEQFYVGLGSPETIQLTLLEGTKLSLESMRIFQQLKHIREKKIEQRTLIRKKIKMISSTINKIKSSMPHVNIQEEIAPPKKPIPMPAPRPKPVKVAPPKPAPKPLTELERIENELKDIESKISSLS